MNGGYVKNAFGGSDQASITGDVKITSLAGSSAGNIYAGCNSRPEEFAPPYTLLILFALSEVTVIVDTPVTSACVLSVAFPPPNTLSALPARFNIGELTLPDEQ